LLHARVIAAAIGTTIGIFAVLIYSADSAAPVNQPLVETGAATTARTSSRPLLFEARAKTPRAARVDNTAATTVDHRTGLEREKEIDENADEVSSP